AQAEAARQAGQAEADARKAAAEALRIERQAEADGIKAKLVAEAAGKKEIAAALNSYSPEAARLQTLPDILASVVKATEAAAAPLGEIERLSIIGGASDAQDAVSGLLGVSPLAVAKIVEALRASGIDLAQLLNRADTVESPAPAQQPVTPAE
ncbi:MAG: flotillin domain-containing protein, partial [Mycobacterium sp.]